MCDGEVSWVSLWKPLLEEAVHVTALAYTAAGRQLASSASAIILSRTSLEAFANEFIEQRRLNNKLKEANLRDKLTGIFKDLQIPVPDYQTSIWPALFLINDIRNSLIHQKAVSQKRGESPKEIVASLEAMAVLQPAILDEAWERRILCGPVAVWCCVGIGRAIKTLERISNGQFRPPHMVCNEVDRILAKLAFNGSRVNHE
jgi:hypothetical protein